MVDHPTYGPPEVTILANCAKQFRYYEENHLAKVNGWEKAKADLDTRRPEQEKEFNELDRKIEDTLRKANANNQFATQIEAFLSDYDLLRVGRIAQACHEANRQWCLWLGDQSQLPWDEAPDWQKDSAIQGVIFVLQNPDAPESALHDKWCADKVADGWIYGPEKLPELKQHHCLVPFNELPEPQQFKDRLFRSIVLGSR